MKRQTVLRRNEIYLLANGDLRLSANQKCWPEQEKMEAALTRAHAFGTAGLRSRVKAGAR